MERKNRRIGMGSVAVSAIAALALGLAAGCRQQKSVDEYLRAGDRAMQQTQFAEAEQSYQAAAKLAPDNPRVHFALGNLYNFEQKPSAAQVEFMKVLNLAPGNANAHSALAQLYESQSQFGAAEEQYRAAVALKPADSGFRLALGLLLEKVGKIQQAESQIRTAIGLAPKDAHAHLALANLLDKLPNRKSEAEAEYARVRALDPHLLAAAPAAASPATATTTVKQARLRKLNRKFRLTKNSPVYHDADTSSAVVAHVHRGKWVHVTGIQGDYLQIKLRSGTVGFIPVTAAE